MPRAVWRGTISFGLVTVPVRLYPAIKRQGVRFRELDRRTGERVHHRRVRQASAWPEPVVGGFERVPQRAPAEEEPRGRREAAPDARPDPAQESRAEPPPDPPPRASEVDVTRDELVRGYEYSPGRFVQVTDDELAQLAPERSKTIDVEQFVSRGQLDPMLFDTPYYVVPDAGIRPYAVLLRAMQQTNRAAVCWIVLRSRRHLAVIQPLGSVMTLTTLLFSDEVMPVDGLQPVLPDDLQERELGMAELLLSTLSGPWEPERYRDEYREKLLALIEGRAAAEEFVEETERKPPAAGVDELMAALQASVEEARARREGESRPTRRREGA